MYVKIYKVLKSWVLFWILQNQYWRLFSYQLKDNCRNCKYVLDSFPVAHILHILHKIENIRPSRFSTTSLPGRMNTLPLWRRLESCINLIGTEDAHRIPMISDNHPFPQSLFNYLNRP